MNEVSPETDVKSLCSTCHKPLPEVGFYCGGCLTQFKCKSCGALLEKENLGCTICGAPKEQQTQSTNNSKPLNSFKIRESSSDRTIEATFTDNVGKDLAAIIRDAYWRKGNASDNWSREISYPTEGKNDIETTQDVEMTEVPNNELVEKKDKTHEHSKNETTKQYATLKAIAMKNLPNSETEWIVVYAFYASNFGENTFTRKDIIAKYTESNRYNKETTPRDLGQYLKRAVQAGYINPLQAEYSLLDQGIEKAEEIISRTTGSSPKLKKSSSKLTSNNGEHEEKEKAIRKTQSTKPLKKLNNIDFFPHGKPSLKQLYDNYSPKNDHERNLIFVHYLQEILKIEAISLNHIYTCYDTLDLRISENLPQTVRNTKSKKGWIETEDTNNIKVTVKGSNQIKTWNKTIN